MPELTFYPVAAGEAISTKANADLPTARANNADAVYTTDNAIRAVNYLQSGNYSVYRCFFPFDTSSLAGGTVVSAVFSIKCHTVTVEHAISLVASTQASATAFAVSDHANFGTTKFADDIADFTNGSFADYTLNAAGIAAVSNTGYTKFALIAAADVAGAGVDGTNMRFYSVNEASEADRPKLVVTYTLPSAADDDGMMGFNLV